jgi:hypothetical protein
MFSHRKNLAAVYVVHPTVWSRSIQYGLGAFTSLKLARKVHEIENWKMLAKYIDLDKIALPEKSKRFITRSFNIVKVNAKGKSQKRFVWHWFFFKFYFMIFTFVVKYIHLREHSTSLEY